MTTPQNPYDQGGQGGRPQQPGGYPQQGGYQQQPGGYQQQPGGYQQQPGGYQQQPGGYPPPAPPLSPHETNRPPRPKSVDTAFLLFMISAALGILSSIFSFLTAEAAAEQARETLRNAGLDASTASLEPSYGSAIFSLVLFAVWIVIVFQMRNGANWARIVLTVLGGLGILFGLIGLLGIGLLFSLGFLGVIQGLFGLIQLGLTIAALVFMYKSDASHYFKAS